MKKYERWYHQLIERARGRALSCYSERHHVLPRALGGGDEPSNIVVLTYREHFLAHWLLTKFIDGEGRRAMQFALAQMRRGKNRKTVSSWQFERAKKASSEAMLGRIHGEEFRKKVAIRMKGKRYALGHKQTTEQKLEKSIMMKGRKHSLGHVWSEGARQLQSNRLHGNKNAVGNRSNTGRKMSEEQKKKLSIKMLGNKNNHSRQEYQI